MKSWSAFRFSASQNISWGIDFSLADWGLGVKVEYVGYRDFNGGTLHLELHVLPVCVWLSAGLPHGRVNK